jgi:hypothetical protein
VVAKPDAGVGALDTFRLENDADLDAFFSAKPETDYIMEAFVQGSIVSFDGLADANGDLVFYTGHRFSQGIMETVNQARHIHYTSMRDIPPALEKAGRQCVRAFNVRERFFHIEFFETGPGKICGPGSEHAPAGGFTTDMFNYACDIDVYRLWAQVMMKGLTPLKYQRKYHCCYASRKNRYTYANSHEAMMARYGNVHGPGGQRAGCFQQRPGGLRLHLPIPGHATDRGDHPLYPRHPMELKQCT